MIRMRIYEAERADHDAADRVFYELVKPVHERHGAEFIGRYRDENGRVIVLWSYPDEQVCRQIQKAVADDPETKGNAEIRRKSGLHAHRYTEYFLNSTEPVHDRSYHGS